MIKRESKELVKEVLEEYGIIELCKWINCYEIIFKIETKAARGKALKDMIIFTRDYCKNLAIKMKDIRRIESYPYCNADKEYERLRARVNSGNLSLNSDENILVNLEEFEEWILKTNKRINYEEELYFLTENFYKITSFLKSRLGDRDKYGKISCRDLSKTIWVRCNASNISQKINCSWKWNVSDMTDLYYYLINEFDF